jgi:hypothetical protein
MPPVSLRVRSSAILRASRPHFVHRAPRRSQRRHAVVQVPLDILHDDNRIVHDDPDRKHEAEKRQRVQRESERLQQPISMISTEITPAGQRVRPGAPVAPTDGRVEPPAGSQ